MASFTRQIVFLRPATFVIFDRISSKNAGFKKTWLLQAMKVPTQTDGHLIISNGKGRLFVQTLLPHNREVRLISGSELYSYGRQNYPPARETGPAPECRIEISPSEQKTSDYFLHVLTATDSNTASVDKAVTNVAALEVRVSVGKATIKFTTTAVGGGIELFGYQKRFVNKVVSEPTVLFKE
jgi:hypothetical protein